ncbi:hypothetical protein OG21DRAFT_1456417 [Imleria badia]|nr:hypothetical protein OG21DRAFT_1456417 [Imleria badia]
MSDSNTLSSPPLHKSSPSYGYNDYEKTLPPSPPTSSKRSTSSRTPSSRSSRERPRNAVPTAKEFMRMLADEQETTRELQQQLTFTTSQLAYEQDRADTAERKIKDAVVRFKDTNEGRISAQADAARLREELKLYKNALEEAQKEIFKAQNILKDVEGRRREAEEEATQLRRKLRKLNEERMVEMAREEGRKLGLQEGLEMGKDIGYLQGRNQGYVNGRSTASKVMERYFSPASESEARRSRGEPDLPSESDAPYTATTTRFPPPADADRPVPLPHQTPAADATHGMIVMELPDGGLPPGFVPAGAETSYTGAGVPLPPSTMGSYHSRLPSSGVVIPPPSGRSGQEESDETSSDGTPPRRYRVPYDGLYVNAGVTPAGLGRGKTFSDRGD